MAVGSGAMISTTHDLGRFYAALLGGRLLAPAQLREMTATVAAPGLGDGLRYGLGVGEIPLSCGGSYFGHLGELLGYRTWVGATPDGTRTAVVYATSDGGQDTQQAIAPSWTRSCAGPAPEPQATSTAPAGRHAPRAPRTAGQRASRTANPAPHAARTPHRRRAAPRTATTTPARPCVRILDTVGAASYTSP